MNSQTKVTKETKNKVYLLKEIKKIWRGEKAV